MHVAQDWDRPRPTQGAPSSAVSYYQPLKFAAPLDAGSDEAFATGVRGRPDSAAAYNGAAGAANGFAVRSNGDSRNLAESHDFARNGVPSGRPSSDSFGSMACGMGFRSRQAVSEFAPAAVDGYPKPETNGHAAEMGRLDRGEPQHLQRMPYSGPNGDHVNGGGARETCGYSMSSSASPPDSAPWNGYRGVNGSSSLADARGRVEPAGTFTVWPDGSQPTPSSSSREPLAPAAPAQSASLAPRPSASTACAGAGAAGGAASGDVEIRGSGELPGPWNSWEVVDFPPRVRAPLVSAGFPAPTTIQQHAWPILSRGRDLIGIAKTGSGKTLAFLLPAFARLAESRHDPRGPPAVLVLAPTRELACQIENEAKQFGAAAGMRAACLYGGAPKGPQLAEMRQRPQVLVATPGRLNDLLDPPPGLSQAVDVKGVQYLVLDEADRMLDMGFEPQIRKIIAGLSKERQTVMFTATWPASVRRLASEFLRDSVEVRVGEVDSLRVNPDVEQRVEFCMDSREKEDRLRSILRDSGDDQAIVFVNTKRMCESVALHIDNSVAIHGDKDQRERDTALGFFKSGARRVLVATDVAARGLDIKSVRLVVNFDPPNRDEDYVHRVGRTGRAGNKGTAIALLTNEDGTAARFIAEILRRGNLPVPEELERRLASGEMRSGGGRDPSRGPRRSPSVRRGGGGGDPFGDDFDIDDMGGGGGSRFSMGSAPPSPACHPHSLVPHCFYP